MDKTNPERRNHAWFASADAEPCRRVRCILAERGTQHVVVHDALKSRSRSRNTRGR